VYPDTSNVDPGDDVPIPTPVAVMFIAVDVTSELVLLLLFNPKERVLL
jgi:hypothetical protein